MDMAKPAKPIRIAGFLPQWSLLRPHLGDINTQQRADAPNISEICMGAMPSSRAIGGSVENTSDCPMPIKSRVHHSKANARLPSGLFREGCACISVDEGMSAALFASVLLAAVLPASVLMGFSR